MAFICPAIDLSSGLTPANVVPSNKILLSGPSPPCKCKVISESFLIPCERKSAELMALTKTSILPEPGKSLRFSLPELGAL